MNILEPLRWRYATKKFDDQRTLTDDQVDQLLEAGNLAATSYGLQPYKFVVVKNQTIQDQLVPASYSQNQVAEASHVIVIAVRDDIDADYINNYTDLMEKTRDLPSGTLDDYRKMMLGTVGRMQPEEVLKWASKQAYIALGTLLAAAATMGIDTCPMEGFMPAEYDQLLDLDAKNLKSVLVLPIGYRADDDKSQHAKKVRMSLSDIVERI
jgi:nitroreductase